MRKPDLLQFLSEDNGNRSSARLISFIITTVILFTWSYTCIKTKTFIPFDYSQVAILLGAFGLKVAQKSNEEKSNGSC